MRRKGETTCKSIVRQIDSLLALFMLLEDDKVYTQIPPNQSKLPEGEEKEK